MFASNNLSAADVAAVAGGNRNNGFGDGDGWWIILLALLFGWGRNGAFGGGYGSGNGGCCAPATCAELQSGFNNQSNQNAYLVAQLKTPAPVPAYTVPNPNGYYGCQQNCYQSCGC